MLRKSMFVGALLAASAANAAITVDQSSVATPGAGEQLVFGAAGHTQISPGTFGSFVGAQFVTAGMSGTLAGIDLQLGRNPANTFGSLTMTLAKNVVFDGDGHPVSYDLLGTTDFAVTAVASTPGLFSLDVSSLGIHLDSGDQFAIVLQGTDGSAGFVGWASGTATAPYSGGPFNMLDYAGGLSYRSVTPDDVEDDGPFVQLAADYGFRTLMDDGVAAPVPEPGEWAMIAGGLGLVGAVARRRRRTA